MKRFLIQILSFLSIFCVFSMGMNQIFHRLVMRQSLLNRTQDQLEQNLLNTNIIALGDSHVQYSLNPEYIPNFFNYSSSGESYLQTYYKFKKIVSVQNSIHMVILPADLHSFSSFRTFRINDDTYWSKYVPYFKLAKESRDSDFYFRWIRTRLFSYIGKHKTFFEGIRSFGKKIVSGEERGLIKGFLPSNLDFASEHEKDKSARATADSHFDGAYSIDPILVKYMGKILNLCKKYDMSVLLIEIPISDRYYKEVLKHCDPIKFNNIINKIMAEYSPGNIIKINSRKLFFGKDYLFRDPDHLNKKGASVYSKYIYERIKKFSES